MICVIEFISKSNVKGDSLFLNALEGLENAGSDTYCLFC